ncbi:MAG: (2Fe-2S)-binding protein [Acidimicrobiia bacterium]|nr:(2Fe-2S)-binding protein [Acidimicrobiia bacterium]
MHVDLVLNGELTAIECADNELILDVVRERLGLTGTKRSCDMEVCGSCTVLLDGLAASACTTLVAEADGKELVTIEGLSDGDELNPVQQAFVDHAAVQCGFCTPGMIMSVQALAMDHPDADDETISEYLSGTICRCTGYVKILEAARQVISE